MPEHNNVCCKFCKMVMRKLVIILITLIQTFHSPSRVLKLTSFQPPDQDNNRICQWPATRKCKRPVTRVRKWKPGRVSTIKNNNFVIIPWWFILNISPDRQPWQFPRWTPSRQAVRSCCQCAEPPTTRYTNNILRGRAGDGTHQCYLRRDAGPFGKKQPGMIYLWWNISLLWITLITKQFKLPEYHGGKHRTQSWQLSVDMT